MEAVSRLDTGWPFSFAPTSPLDQISATFYTLGAIPMAGFTTTEGDALLADMACKRVLTDRDANLLLGLFTNSSATTALNHSTVTEPTGTGYGRITLTDASWTGSAATRSYATQTFTAGAGGWTGSVYGYFIITQASGGTPRLVWAEIDAAGPYTFAAGDTYAITLNITFA